jgi:CheY-like chemotaxis protein/uncharacterized membrane-anchored protein YhcB (DUF1043 family)
MNPLIPFFVALIAGALGFLIAKLRPPKIEELEIVEETKAQLETAATELQQNRSLLQQTRAREETLLNTQTTLQKQVHVVQTQLSQSHEHIQKTQENMQKTLEQTQQLTQALQQSEDSQKRLTQKLREYEEDYLRQQPRTSSVPLATTSTIISDVRPVTPPSLSSPTPPPAPISAPTPETKATKAGSRAMRPSTLTRAGGAKMGGVVYLVTDQKAIQEQITKYFHESGYTLQVSPFTHLLSTLPHLASEKSTIRAILLDVYKGNDDQWDMLVTLSQQKEIKGIPLLALVSESEKEKAMERGANQSIPWPTESAMVLSILSSAQIARNLRNDLATRAARLTQSYQSK